MIIPKFGICSNNTENPGKSRKNSENFLRKCTMYLLFGILGIITKIDWESRISGLRFSEFVKIKNFGISGSRFSP